MKKTQIITMTLCLSLSTLAFSQVKTTKTAPKTSRTGAKATRGITNPVKSNALKSMRMKAIPSKMINKKITAKSSTGALNSATHTAKSTASAIQFYNASVIDSISLPTTSDEISATQVLDELYNGLDEAEYVFSQSDADLELVDNYRNEISKPEWASSLAPLLKFSGLFHGAHQLAKSPANQVAVDAGQSVLRPSLTQYAAQQDLLPQVQACSL